MDEYKIIVDFGGTYEKYLQVWCNSIKYNY